MKRTHLGLAAFVLLGQRAAPVMRRKVARRTRPRTEREGAGRQIALSALRRSRSAGPSESHSP